MLVKVVPASIKYFSTYSIPKQQLLEIRPNILYKCKLLRISINNKSNRNAQMYIYNSKSLLW